MKKGFTLIELLAVLVVLGVLMIIAVPRIGNLIINSRNASFAQSNNAIIRSAENYFNSINNQVFLEVGESLEVSYQTLIDNNFLDEIVNPFQDGTCNGYVIIHQASENEKTITPFTSCYDDINSSSEDDLVLFYNFSEDEESTINVFPRSQESVFFTNAYNGSSYGFNETTNMRQELANHRRLNDESSVTKVSRIVSGQNQRDYVSWSLHSPLGSTRIFTFYYFGTVGTSIRPYNNDSSANLYYLNDNGEWIGGTTAVNIPVQENIWQKITIKMENRNVAAGTGLSWMILHYNNITMSLSNEEYWLFTMPQLEEKEYPTRFTPNERNGLVNNLVSDNFNASLNLANTPRWVRNGYNDRGAYFFSGNSERIDTNYGASINMLNNPRTISVWAKPSSFSGNPMIFSTGQRVSSNNRLYVGIRNGLWDMGIQNTGWGSGVIPATLNEWDHIAVTLDNGVATLYVNGEISRTISYTSYAPDDPIRLGMHNTGYSYEGYLDDFRVYQKAMSDLEIEQLYLASLR